jgi:hypothetical protein
MFCLLCVCFPSPRHVVPSFPPSSHTLHSPPTARYAPAAACDDDADHHRFILMQKKLRTTVAISIDQFRHVFSDELEAITALFILNIATRIILHNITSLGSFADFGRLVVGTEGLSLPNCAMQNASSGCIQPTVRLSPASFTVGSGSASWNPVALNGTTDDGRNAASTV